MGKSKAADCTMYQESLVSGLEECSSSKRTKCPLDYGCVRSCPDKIKSACKYQRVCCPLSFNNRVGAVAVFEERKVNE